MSSLASCDINNHTYYVMSVNSLTDLINVNIITNSMRLYIPVSWTVFFGEARTAVLQITTTKNCVEK